MPVRQHVDRSVLVGSHNMNVRLFESLQKLGIGMPVRIVLTGGNDRPARVDRGQEIRRCGVPAAVMADLQYICLQVRSGVYIWLRIVNLHDPLPAVRKHSKHK